jgi:hypothetical protein
MGPVYFVSVMLASYAAEVTNTWPLSDAGHPLNYTLIDYRADGRAACQLRGVPRANNVDHTYILFSLPDLPRLGSCSGCVYSSHKSVAGRRDPPSLCT